MTWLHGKWILSWHHSNMNRENNNQLATTPKYSSFCASFHDAWELISFRMVDLISTFYMKVSIQVWLKFCIMKCVVSYTALGMWMGDCEVWCYHNLSGKWRQMSRSFMLSCIHDEGEGRGWRWYIYLYIRED